MAERGIIYSAPMIRALFEERKSQTRRIAKDQAVWTRSEAIVKRFPHQKSGLPVAVGDREWVRETWAPNEGMAGGAIYRADHGGACGVQAWNLAAGTCTHLASRWRPSTQMPRWASRAHQVITGVRVERLQDISEADARAEGIEAAISTDSGQFFRNYQVPGCPLMAYGAYRSLWNSLHGPDAWDLNPWVVVREFQFVPHPIDKEPRNG